MNTDYYQEIQRATTDACTHYAKQVGDTATVEEIAELARTHGAMLGYVLQETERLLAEQARTATLFDLQDLASYAACTTIVTTATHARQLAAQAMTIIAKNHDLV